MLIPEIIDAKTAVIWKPLRKEDHLIHKFRHGQFDKMIHLKNKSPTWNSQLNAYVLNFSGRVIRASIKNFQLVSHLDGNLSLITTRKSNNAIWKSR